MTRMWPSCVAESLLFCLYYKFHFIEYVISSHYFPNLIGFYNAFQDKNHMNKWRCYLRHSFYFCARRRGHLIWIEQEMTAFLREFWAGKWKSFMQAGSLGMFNTVQERTSSCTEKWRCKEWSVLHSITLQSVSVKEPVSH